MDEGDSCKPQLAEALLKAPGMSKALEGKLLISILAGTTISMMTEWVPASCTVVRSMPNTPTKVRPPLSRTVWRLMRVIDPRRNDGAEYSRT
jgi:pyrroline-5-carboxylate reductase